MAKLCVKCKNLLPDNAQFCERCGTRQPGPTPAAPPPAKKNNTGLTVLIVVLAVIAVAAITVCVILLTGGSGNTPAPTTPAVTEPAQTEPPQTPETDGDETLPPHADPAGDDAGEESDDGTDAPVTGDTPDTPAAPDTPPATPGNDEPLPGPVQPEGLSVDTFNQMMEGVWVDLDSVSPMGEEYTFSFCQFSGGRMWFAVYPGGGSQTGTVTDVVAENDGTFTVTFYYPEEDYMGDHYAERYEQYALELYDTILVFSDDPGTAWTWMGYDLDSAKQAVNQR